MEQQNWELMGAVYKQEAEALRVDRKGIVEAVRVIKKDLVDFLECPEIKPIEFNAICTLLELAK